MTCCYAVLDMYQVRGVINHLIMANGKVKFVVRKYIMATSAQEAIRLDKSTPVHDVWVDERWMEQDQMASNFMGFGSGPQVKPKKGQKQ